MTVTSGRPDRTAPADEKSSSPLDYLSLLLLRWRLVLACAFGAALVAVLVTFVLKRRWTADVSFLPVSTSPTPIQSAIGNLAGDLGLAIPGTSPTDSPEFYVALLKSREILDGVLTAKYQFGGDSLSLLEILEVDGDTPAEQLEKGRDRLSDLYTAASDRSTQVVTVTATAPDPELAAAVASQFVLLVNRFNQDTRESQAGATRRFVEVQVAETEGELHNAEDSLREFRTRNRRTDTPELQFEDGRLQRQVQIQQDLYISLRQQYESARIQEVNNTPVLSVIDQAVVPVKPSFPRPVRTGVIAFLIGGVIGVGFAIVQSATDNLRATRDPGFVRLRQAWSSMWDEMRRVLPGRHAA
jgi:uncharacterized protein involved in exopolysaccharide biosynthesis